MPFKTSSRTRKRSSGSSCATCRTPLSFVWAVKLLELRLDGRRAEVYPSDHPGDELVPGREIQQEARLVEGLRGLHRDRAGRSRRPGGAGRRSAGRKSRFRAPMRSSIQPWVFAV